MPNPPDIAFVEPSTLTPLTPPEGVDITKLVPLTEPK